MKKSRGSGRAGQRKASKEAPATGAGAFVSASTLLQGSGAAGDARGGGGGPARRAAQGAHPRS